jgi:hypothetical protein
MLHHTLASSADNGQLQVCKYMQQAELLSKDGIETQTASQLRTLQSMATLITSHASTQAAGKNGASTAISADALERSQPLLPTQRLMFDGQVVTPVDGWAYTQGTAVKARIL